MRLWSDNPWDWGIILLGEKMEIEKHENRGIIPENFDKMEWKAINAKLSVFGVKDEMKFVASAAWQLDHRWTWVIHGTRFKGTEVTKEKAQEAAFQIFIAAKNIPEQRKEKDAVKNKKKDRKDDRHGESG
jgi:hypothetical protein